MTVLVALHALAAVVWVGGMFFAYVVLRPSAGPLQPPERLALWRRVFGKFFPWVWASVIVLFVTGFAALFGYFGGFAGAGIYIHLMLTVGLVMTALFVYLYYLPWRLFRQAVDGGAPAEAAPQLDKIRHIVAVNLVLGLITVAIGAGGRYW